MDTFERTAFGSFALVALILLGFVIIKLLLTTPLVLLAAALFIIVAYFVGGLLEKVL